MCGLAGVMSKNISFQEQEVFEDLFTMATMRGRVGSGVIFINDRGAARTFRSTNSAVSLMESKRYSELSKEKLNCIIGHARMPTKGDLTIDSVHPHISGSIAGVHNGTLFTVNGTRVEKESDSKLLFEAIAKDGIDKVVDKTFGAYALVWADAKTGTVNFLRNKDRPLWFGASHKDRPFTIWWASEPNMIQLAMLRHGYKDPAIWELPADTLQSYPMAWKNGAVVPQSEREVKKVYANFSPTSNIGPGSAWRDGQPYGSRGQIKYHFHNGKWSVSETWLGNETIEAKPLTSVPLLPAPKLPEVPNDKINDLFPERKTRKLSRAEKKRLRQMGKELPHNAGHSGYIMTTQGCCLRPGDVKYILEKTGCANCNGKEDFEAAERKSIRWVGKKEFLCEECSVSDEVRKSLISVYPDAWPEYKGSEDGEPLAVDEQLALKMKEAHNFH